MSYLAADLNRLCEIFFLLSRLLLQLRALLNMYTGVEVHRGACRRLLGDTEGKEYKPNVRIT